VIGEPTFAVAAVLAVAAVVAVVASSVVAWSSIVVRNELLRMKALTIWKIAKILSAGTILVNEGLLTSRSISSLKQFRVQTLVCLSRGPALLVLENSVHPLCSLCLCVESWVANAHHRGTEDTEVAQRKAKLD
jgi:hypothetical protein